MRYFVCAATSGDSVCPDTFNMLIISRHPLFRLHPMALSQNYISSAAERLDRAEKTRKGDTIQADYGPYGPVSCHFRVK
jgi:hypothetical protein